MYKIKITLTILIALLLFNSSQIFAQTHWGKCTHYGNAHTKKGYEAYLDCDNDGIAELKCIYNFKDGKMVEKSCEDIKFEPKIQRNSSIHPLEWVKEYK